MGRMLEFNLSLPPQGDPADNKFKLGGNMLRVMLSEFRYPHHKSLGSLINLAGWIMQEGGQEHAGFYDAWSTLEDEGQKNAIATIFITAHELLQGADRISRHRANDEHWARRGL